LVAGILLKSGGSFVIDHPADPEHDYLCHSFVESPDMMNIYNGNVVTGGSETAIVTLLDWFETLNQVPLSAYSDRPTGPSLRHEYVLLTERITYAR
jgi:hypothetical protein